MISKAPLIYLTGTPKPNYNRGIVLVPNPVVRSLPRLSMTGIILTLVLLLAACGGDSPTAPPASGPAPTIAPTQTSPPTTTAPPMTPGPTTAPTAAPALPLILELLSPEDGAGVDAAGAGPGSGAVVVDGAEVPLGRRATDVQQTACLDGDGP